MSIRPATTLRGMLLGLPFCLLLAFTGAAAQDRDSIDEFGIEPVFEVLRPDGAGAATLELDGPGQQQFTFEFGPDEPLSISSSDLARAGANDGLYAWRATFTPQLDEATRQALAASRTDPDVNVELVSIPARSGSVRVLDSGFLVPVVDPGPSSGDDSDAGGDRQVITGDLVVYNSTCIGFDCPTSPLFEVDTLRLQENNLRIHFDDTSSTGSFPGNDWRLLANDINSGGASYFAIEDSTAGRIPFRVEAGAPAASLYIDAGGRIGVGTNMPVVELHTLDGDTPTLRLAQDGSSGFASQTWDVAGNETNFFVRDTTNASRLPLRIRPGAPTSSLDIAASGAVGMGVQAPTAALHMVRPGGYTDDWLRIETTDDMDPATEDRRLVVDNAGNLFVGGAITQLSSRSSKENLLAVAGDQLLAKLSELPIWTWNYLSSNAADRHIGPVAEDFYRTFGFGTSERSLSPSDMAGVALAASQALQQEIQQRDQRIEELEARLARLEAALLAEENTVDPER
ncbi:tail fiber domain-containing protein [Wenzhouxiangella sp. XN79A]|uniref:tail fiber domain-containing protein n=1 Tax=Wenzhouxiangella sp. XN79A TaxID=2724193 RepID=UPI00144A901F|nr:tail fiber domain-containing protein [Wenzhouxiangella sp. XN79A]NKI33995.1 tail fiber domain-containing protein [Wenzhouxiangella sp. XN79A]